MKNYHGCWPTMVTPFTENGNLDFKAIDGLVKWYIKKGADGIFAVCQSSEMFYLADQEKLDLAKAVVESAEGRIKVIASGHTDDDLEKQIDQLGKMNETGVDAVVLVSNRLAKEDEDEEVFVRNANTIFRQLPEVTFGFYECPFPYLRLLTTPFLEDCAKAGKLVFLKDVSCSLEIQKQRIEAIKGTNISLFNANTSTLLDSLQFGYDGYNGVMANFHIDLYKWLYLNFDKDPKTAKELMDFLTLAGVIEARCYPVSAKWYQNEYGVPMSLNTRVTNKGLLNENGIHELRSLHRIESAWRDKLGLNNE
jgi:4-hydroxy-tetrahydrodipicolinate synthase